MSEPIRVLHVIGIMNRGGAETMIMNLYRHIDRSKVQFDFVENSREPAAFDEEILDLGGRIYRCPHYNGKNHFTYVKWWNDFFKAHPKEYPIVHGHLGSTAAIYLSIAKKYGAYAIAHSHSSGTDHSLRSYLYQMMSYNTRNVADYFFACSEAAGKDRFGRKVISGDHYAVLNNAIDVNQFSYNSRVREVVRDELGIGQNQLVVSHIGRYTKEKNHEFILKIFSELRKLGLGARLLMIGDGTLRTHIMQMAEQASLSSDVIFTGVRSDVERLMQAMDVFVLPSLYEGLPVTMVEAQAAGLPCIISDKVPPECILTEGLVDVMPLSASPGAWAEKILAKRAIPRTDRRAEIAAHGFDITTEAVKLQEFYLKAYEQNC